MKFSIAKNKWIKESNLRLDAKFHLSDGRRVRSLMDFSPYGIINLGSVADKIFYGGRARRNYVSDPNRGVAFMGSADMLKSDFNSLKYISKKNTQNLQGYFLRENWILVSRSGTIGNTVYTNADYLNKAASEHIIRIVPNGKIKSGALYAYLTSKFGYSLMTQGTFGAVIQHIEPDFLAALPVPNLPKKLQDDLHEIITKVAELRAGSTSSLKKAHELFEGNIFKLGKSKLPTTGKFSSDYISNGFQSRIDASYYLTLTPIEDDFKSSINYKSLESLVKQPMFTAQRGRRNYVKKGIKFLSTSDVSQNNPLLIEKYLSLKTDGLKSLVVKKDWILVASSGQEILGNVFLVDDTYSDCAVNQHSIRVIIDEQKVSPHYIFGYLSSPRIRKYIRAGIYGSAILTINEDFLGRIKVPFLSDHLMNEISNYIKAYQAQKEEASKLSEWAKVFLQMAKPKVF